MTEEVQRLKAWEAVYTERMMQAGTKAGFHPAGEGSWKESHLVGLRTIGASSFLSFFFFFKKALSKNNYCIVKFTHLK